MRSLEKYENHIVLIRWYVLYDENPCTLKIYSIRTNVRRGGGPSRYSHFPPMGIVLMTIFINTKCGGGTCRSIVLGPAKSKKTPHSPPVKICNFGECRNKLKLCSSLFAWRSFGMSFSCSLLSANQYVKAE